MLLKKIVVIGPESTGKSSLCEGLASYFNTNWVKEYAREYLIKYGTGYSFEDLYTIAQGQLKIEDEASLAINDKSKPLIIDTDMQVMKVWSEFVFGKCDNRILTTISKRQYNLYLLCNIDLPWVKDELREYPDLQTREKLFHHYKQAMVMQDVPWKIISGQGEERLQIAIEAVKEVL